MLQKSAGFRAHNALLFFRHLFNATLGFMQYWGWVIGRLPPSLNGGGQP
jgi:hypothetical protein